MGESLGGAEIVGTGRSVPSKLLSNDMISKMIDTSDEWITSRTGIKQRYVCNEGGNEFTLALNAAEKAILNSGIDRQKISFCIVASFTSHLITPSTACLLQKNLMLSEETMAFDFNAACTGFVYGLSIANALLAQHKDRYALLVGSEQLSKYIDMNDRSTSILFGDGAGAVVLRYNEKSNFSSLFGSRGDENALSCANENGDQNYIRMDGKDVFRFATETVPMVVVQLLKKTNLTIDDIDYIVCHQANKRIIDSAIKKLGVTEEQKLKFYTNIDKYANTSAASIPIALDEMFEKGMLEKGMKIICVGFGAGLTWGGTIFDW